MKQTLKDFLYWWLSKLEGQRIEKVEIGKEIVVSLKRVIPKNGKWYDIALTVEAWARFHKGEKEATTMSSIGVWKNSKKIQDKLKKDLVSAWTFDELP